MERMYRCGYDTYCGFNEQFDPPPPYVALVIAKMGMDRYIQHFALDDSVNARWNLGTYLSKYVGRDTEIVLYQGEQVRD